jgi:hypothetical protein
VLDLPGQDVPIVRGSIRGHQLATHRQSYVNALLIASRGIIVRSPCPEHCQTQRPHPFISCVRLPGFWAGCCANCKWPDHGIQCSARDALAGRVASAAAQRRPAFQPGFVLEEDPDLLILPGPPSAPRRAGQLLLPAPGDSAENPVELDDGSSDAGEGGSAEDPVTLD